MIISPNLRQVRRGIPTRSARELVVRLPVAELFPPAGA